MPVDLGPIGDYCHGRAQIVDAGGRQFTVARWRDEIFVFRNACPHENGPLGLGSVVPRINCGASGLAEADDSHPVVVCPWHHWEFSLRDGAALADERYRIRMYETWVANGRVCVELGPRTR